jgi:hypothetical protein
MSSSRLGSFQTSLKQAGDSVISPGRISVSASVRVTFLLQ